MLKLKISYNKKLELWLLVSNKYLSKEKNDVFIMNYLK